MPRANRHSFPGQVLHLTHRCHKKQWLLKFSRDRLRWIHWLFKAKQRFGLCVLNYMVTSNHVHLLVLDQGRDEVSESMQLISGRTAQEFNRRKNRRGAFWEDRYHATAVQTDTHLAKCMTYIDLNMVRAGAVTHPDQWRYCGFHELMSPPRRKAKLDTSAMLNLFEQDTCEDLARLFRTRAADDLLSGKLEREAHWSEAVMIGEEKYIRSQLQSTKVRYPGLRVVAELHDYTLREPAASYSPYCGFDMRRLAYKTALSRA